jgi:hypothetical protein
MKLLRQLWYWVLLKNPTGLACLLTAWGIGILYSALAYTGLMSGLNAPLAMKFSGIAGLAFFVVMPILIRIFRSQS